MQQRFNFLTLGKVIFQLIDKGSKWKIAIDRTNWKFGKSNLNFFVASVIFGNLSLPVAWLLLDKQGNSSTKERKKLIKIILKIIPLKQIEILVADREFVGEEWIKFLCDLDIPFAIRAKKVN